TPSNEPASLSSPTRGATTMRYGVIGNSGTAALIHENGSIDWCCLPRFDSPSAFGALLDPDAGHFQVRAADEANSRQTYLDRTAILRTEFDDGETAFAVIDFMPRYRDGQSWCRPTEILRILKPLRGRPSIRVVFDPKLNYARGETVAKQRNGYVMATNGLEDLYLYGSLPMASVMARAAIPLETDHFLLLSYHEKFVEPTLVYANDMFERTREYWEAWSNESRLPSRWPHEVLRSAITLKLLTYEETGAMVAAATTSLPEAIGESRNWDYRFCWLRDASLVLESMKSIGHFREAKGFITFLLHVFESKQTAVQILYRVDGRTDLAEQTLPHLRGYKNSKPVRIGNDACRQRQNDIFGEVLNTIHLYYFHYQFESMPAEVWSLVKFMVNTAVRDWRSTDAGIWELRTRRKHFTHSKMLSWVAVDRGVRIARAIGRTDMANEWAPVADTIRADIMRKGWKPGIGSLTQTYGSNFLDISLLQAARLGFIGQSDPRWISTVKKCAEALCRDGFVFRYTNADDYGKPKSAFIPASLWMAKALYTIGEKDRSVELLERVLSIANHVGLLSEDVDVATHELLGNVPQAYSHMAVINTATLLSKG
ncbi:MAG TPA: glycoside hydrolase family 15 protein, partial [Candidatus Krumholzibacteria bacterium]|nr:glycoside hydrolase family 15 protein [Candidatus Krumholzibacteria bacterium]